MKVAPLSKDEGNKIPKFGRWRPLMISSYAVKILELYAINCVKMCINAKVDAAEILNDQHAFLKGKSLLTAIESFSRGFVNSNKPKVAMFVDLSNAYN